MDSFTAFVRELSAQFLTVPIDDVHRQCADAMKQLNGSLPATALPEMLNRLVRMRLTADLQAAKPDLDSRSG